MKKTWLAKYQNNEIKVEAVPFKEVSLFVNDEIQDKKLYFSRNELNTSLLDSNMLIKEIKVEFKGFFKPKCYIVFEDKKIRARCINQSSI